jgi:hypothetical protein
MDMLTSTFIGFAQKKTKNLTIPPSWNITHWQVR